MGGPGSGAKPKIYAPNLVADVQRLYAAGLTQVEVANVLGLTQKVVWNVMRRHNIPRRPQVKRHQRGEANSSWRGRDAGYAALHKRVEALRGKPQCCSRCGEDDPNRRYEWANLTGNYHDVHDYERMCVRCHRRYDAARRRGGDA